jgi:RNA polymerase sigma-70 factor, ECF subfamily
MRTRSQFDTLALPHLPSIYRLARQLAGPDRADDVVQETFLRAWAHFHTFDPATNCRAWLCRILHNTWISQWRRTRLELPLGDVDVVASEPSYEWEEERLSDELSTDMQWALDQLPEAYRWAVLLADVEELSYQEIAATMDCPIGTVMSRVSRGRRMLGRLLHEPKEARPALRMVARRAGSDV